VGLACYVINKKVRKLVLKPYLKIIFFLLKIGILEIFLSLEQTNQEIISASVQNVVKDLDDDSKRKLLLVLPESARRFIGF